MIDGIDVRAENCAVEVGLFRGEECVQVLQLNEAKARELLEHLGEAIDEGHPAASCGGGDDAS